MARIQTDNGGKDTMHPFGAPELLKPPPEVVEAVERAGMGARARARGGPPGGVVARNAGVAEGVNYGPCLYFGPRGERCERRAIATGFCARHSPARAAWGQGSGREPPGPAAADENLASGDGAETRGDANGDSVRKRSRILVALLGLVGVLWPILHEVLRALISFLHSK